VADAKGLFEVVPGVSSFVAVPNYAGVPLTHREFCSKITLITGHEDPAKEQSKIDWAQVAKTPGTKVIMMGTDRIGEIAKMLIEHGMNPQTPVAVTQWGTTDRQVSISSPLAEIGKAVTDGKIGPSTVAVIGEVVNLRSKLNWSGPRRCSERNDRDPLARAAGGLSERLKDSGGSH
jgi:uroporphyrinogen III methyltransferase/synthase